jgi:hypothetical protein
MVKNPMAPSFMNVPTYEIDVLANEGKMDHGHCHESQYIHFHHHIKINEYHYRLVIKKQLLY